MGGGFVCLTAALFVFDTMKAIIFATGPSLKLAIGKRFRASLRIAVNEAVHAEVNATHHCYGDFSKLNTTPNGVIPVTGLRPDGKFVDWREFEKTMPWSPAFSTLAAIGFAVWKGATAIDIYGADMDGTESFDGTIKGGREQSRWQREHDLFNELVNFYPTVKINRISK